MKKVTVTINEDQYEIAEKIAKEMQSNGYPSFTWRDAVQSAVTYGLEADAEYIRSVTPLYTI